MYNIVLVCFFLTDSDGLTKGGPAQKKIGEATFNLMLQFFCPKIKGSF